MKGGADLTSVLALVTFTALVMLGGGVVVWDVATAVSRAARLITSSQRIDPTLVPNRSDDIGALLSSFARMAATIEQQAEELRRVPATARRAGPPGLSRSADEAGESRAVHRPLGPRDGQDGAKGRLLGVLFLDLDRFKVVNDSLGHVVGDQILIEVGRRLRNSVRPEDTVARLGGDEFGIMLEGLTSIAGATHVAERITAHFEQPFVVDGRDVFITCSIGIAFEPLAPDAARTAAPLRGPGDVPGEDERRGALRDLRRHHQRAVGGAPRPGDWTCVARCPERVHRCTTSRWSTSETNRIVALEALIRWAHPRRDCSYPRTSSGSPKTRV